MSDASDKKDASDLKHQDHMEVRLQQIETRLDRGNTRLDALDLGQDRSNTRLDALDRGQAAMIRRMDAQDVERAELRTEIGENTNVTRETLELTRDVRALAQNMQSAARFFNKIYDYAAWTVRALSATAKLLWPIAALLILLWGAIYAWTHGGKPPSVG